MGKSLEEIGRGYGTDKSSLDHGYLEQYEQLFPEPERVRGVLEIGLRRGGDWQARNKHRVPSLAMWRDFFPNAHVYGLDLKTLPVDDPRITTVVGDQSSAEDLARLRRAVDERLDLIVDDGSHRPEHMGFTFLQLHDLVRPGGFYIIEDLLALVMLEYPLEQRIQAILDAPPPDLAAALAKFEMSWVSSLRNGPKATVVLRRKC